MNNLMSADPQTTGVWPVWQPIDTAPKDDVIVLTDGGMLYQGFWQQGRGWMSGLKSGAILITLELAPTHWMPLPKGPEA